MKKWKSSLYIAVALAISMVAFTGCQSADIQVSEIELDHQEVESSSGEETTGFEDYDPLLTGTYEDGDTPEFSGEKLRLTIDGEDVVIAMYDNTAVDAFLERLPLEDLSFFDLSGVEKPVERPEEPFSLGEEVPGYDPVTGEMVIYRPWGNFTIFYGDFRYSSELVPLGKVESGIEILAGQTEDFTGKLELMENE